LLNTAGDETYRDEKEEDRRNEGKADKGNHQFGSQLGPENLPFPFEDQFHQVADDEKDQEQNENDVDVDQTKDDDVVGDGNGALNLGDLHFDRRKNDDQDRNDPNDQELLAPPSRLWGEVFGLTHCQTHPISELNDEGQTY
jgi:hypothetical protein